MSPVISILQEAHSSPLPPSEEGVRAKVWYVCIALLAVFLTSAMSHFAWTNQLNDSGGDSAYYMLMAQYFSFGGGGGEGLQEALAQNAYPPLYPALLGVFGGGSSFLVAHQVTAISFALSIIAWCFWMRAERLTLGLTLIGALVLVAMPGVHIRALHLHSEPLFMLLAMAVLAMLAGSAQSIARALLVVLLASAAMYTRSIGIVLVAVSLFALFQRRSPGRWHAVALAVCAYLALKLGAQGGGRSYFSILGDHAQSLSTQSVLQLVKLQLWALGDGWRLNIAGAGIGWLVPTFLGLVAAIAGAIRAWRGKADGYFVLLYLVVFLAWPFPAERQRLITPIVPVLFAQILLVLRDVVANRPSRPARYAPRVVIGLFAICLLPGFLSHYDRFTDPKARAQGVARSPAWYEIGVPDDRMNNALFEQAFWRELTQLGTIVPSGDCVYSIKPSLVTLLSRRASVATPLGNEAATPSSCRFVYMLPFASPTYREPLYPMRSWADRLDDVRPITPSGDGSAIQVGVLASIKRMPTGQ
jgi:hypothetical protein